MNVMSSLKARRSQWASVAVYVSAAALSVILTAMVFGFRREAVRMPFTYQGDTMFYHLLIKGMIDHGWFLDNPQLAAPGSLDLRDVPSSDNNFYFVLLKLLAFIKPLYPQALNAFYFLGFPLTTLSALFVLRRFGVSYLAGIFVSLLYSFLPYHFIRGQHHLFLSAYYYIPLLVMVALWICRGELPMRGPKLIGSLVICLLVASTGYYYAFFACFFLLVAGLVARNLRALLLPAALILVIFAGVALNFAPSIARFSSAGSVHFTGRLAAEADVYGLRIAQLILPVRWHRVKSLADLKTDYNMRPLVNENDDASLGFIGSLGFLGLLWWFLFRKPGVSALNAEGRRGLLHHLSLLNGAALLVATIGGLGSLVAFFGLPQVRAYNRISIFIAFFALFAVALWLDGVAERHLQSRARQVVFCVVLGMALALGMLDQISPRFLPDYRRAEDEFMSDEVFVKQIESRLPPDSMIFQLPVVSFPENPKIHKLNDYDLGRGYLHSSQLRWSYGTIKGREGDIWNRMIAAKPTGEMVETLALGGFGGIYLDRFGFADNGAKIEGELSSLLAAPPLISPNDRLVFFDLSAYRQTLAAKFSEAELAARREAALHPILAVWQGGFSEQEGTADDYWRWCGPEGTMKIVNRTPREQQMHLEMTLAADHGGQLAMESEFFNERLTIDRWGQRYEKSITVPPGEHAVRFHCDAQRVLSTSDFRELVFRVRNFKLTSAEAPVEEKKAAGAVAGR